MPVQGPSAASYAESGVAYWTPGSPLFLLGNPVAEAAPGSMRRLLAAARAGGVPVVWSEVNYTSPSMADAGRFWRKSKVLNLWQEGDERGLAAPLEGLEPAKSNTVIVNKYASAFFGTALATELQSDHLGVRATALDAMQHGFHPMVVETACDDRTPEIQHANLFDLDSKYEDVVAEEEAVVKLRIG
ncbi:putative N-carbamoylsarcosine amidase [Xylariomycetidae sp. FL2044]|nr:putative N-carbamoylsarcosine amidase [Xylariomycetidae sp. FL2044]